MLPDGHAVAGARGRVRPILGGVNTFPGARGDVEGPEVTVVVEGGLVQGGEFPTCCVEARWVVLWGWGEWNVPKRKILPPPVGVATTAWAERGPGQVGEVNLRHSSYVGGRLRILWFASLICLPYLPCLANI